jgi:hypothetical protein
MGRDLISFFVVKGMGYRFNNISEAIGVCPVTAGKRSEAKVIS